MTKFDLETLKTHYSLVLLIKTEDGFVSQVLDSLNLAGSWLRQV
jgi:hypothetical protein